MVGGGDGVAWHEEGRRGRKGGNMMGFLNFMSKGYYGTVAFNSAPVFSIYFWSIFWLVNWGAGDIIYLTWLHAGCKLDGTFKKRKKNDTAIFKRGG